MAAPFPYAGNPAAAAISISAAGLFVVIDEFIAKTPDTRSGGDDLFGRYVPPTSGRANLAQQPVRVLTLEGEGHFVAAIVIVRGESSSPQKVQLISGGGPSVSCASPTCDSSQTPSALAAAKGRATPGAASRT